uniref:AIG1-type G domain-containing protein n=1 Tax=Neogobius melanostomus TaxID=47308 RepID=A0A8C6S839_9GOBI
MDSDLNLNSHIKAITSSAFYHLKNIAKIRGIVSKPDLERLIHAFVSSRLDYCNGLLTGLSKRAVRSSASVSALASCRRLTPEGLRIALVGKTGCGKSSTGNTILGRQEEFYAKTSGKSVTQICRKAVSFVDGRRVAVVDTPGLFDTSLSNEETIKETVKSISLLAPGPHAFLLLIQIGRFTEEEQRAVEYIKRAFGKGAEKYIMILFTCGDNLEHDKMNIDDYIRDSDPALKKLIADCGNRFHVFNNRNKEHTQVKELLQKIDHMVEENGGSFYTSEMPEKKLKTKTHS